MTEVTKPRPRPLSPHLQAYRLPYNALMSISGRAAGVVLSLFTMALFIWFIAVVWNPEMYGQTMLLLDNPYTEYVALALAFLIFFYLGNGVRHVLWERGIGVNEKAGITSGNIVLLLSALMTLGVWALNEGYGAQYLPMHDMKQEVAQ